MENSNKRSLCDPTPNPNPERRRRRAAGVIYNAKDNISHETPGFGSLLHRSDGFFLSESAIPNYYEKGKTELIDSSSPEVISSGISSDDVQQQGELFKQRMHRSDGFFLTESAISNCSEKGKTELINSSSPEVISSGISDDDVQQQGELFKQTMHRSDGFFLTDQSAIPNYSEKEETEVIDSIFPEVICSGMSDDDVLQLGELFKPSECDGLLIESAVSPNNSEKELETEYTGSCTESEEEEEESEEEESDDESTRIIYTYVGSSDESENGAVSELRRLRPGPFLSDSSDDDSVGEFGFDSNGFLIFESANSNSEKEVTVSIGNCPAGEDPLNLISGDDVSESTERHTLRPSLNSNEESGENEEEFQE